MRISIFAGLCCAALTLLVPAAGAADRELLRTLRENNTITAEQYQRLLGADGADAAGQAGQPSASPKGPAAPAVVLGGRIMVDAAFYQADKYGQGDGTELRRARFELEGDLAGGFAFELGVDVADGGAEVKDAVLQYRFDAPLVLGVGHFKEPFSLEELTSSKYLTFMERGLPNAFAPGRAIGVGLHGWGRRWTASAGLFGQPYDDEASRDSDDEGWGGSCRLTLLPFSDEQRLLHLGAAASYRQPSDQALLAFDSRPEAHTIAYKYVNTGDLSGVEEYWRGGGEIALVHGPWSLQAEYIHATVHFEGGPSAVDFAGWYAYVSWVVTGETRPYKKKSGTFGRLRPKRRGGAVELAMRVSHIDLTDGSIAGGTERNHTVAVNWYVTEQVRLAANYILVDNDLAADDAASLPGGDDDPSILQFRLQVDF